MVGREIRRYPNAEILWCQEEPLNMGRRGILNKLASGDSLCSPPVASRRLPSAESISPGATRALRSPITGQLLAFQYTGCIHPRAATSAAVFGRGTRGRSHAHHLRGSQSKRLPEHRFRRYVFADVFWHEESHPARDDPRSGRFRPILTFQTGRVEDYEMSTVALFPCDRTLTRASRSSPALFFRCPR